jgi:PAS domain S-box-containing protein
VSALIVPFVSTVVLVGWLVDVEFLTRVIPNSVAMNPMSAVSFLLVGAGLWLSRPVSDTTLSVGWKHLTVQACAVAVGLIAAVRLLGYALGWDVNIDRLLFADKLGPLGGDLPNRMAPNTAFNFLLAASAILFLDSRGWRWLVFSQAPTLLILLTAFIAFLGYTVGAPSLYRPLPYIGMAVHTAFCFILLGLGILGARSDRGLAAIATSSYLGGTMARRMLPMTVLIFMTIVWLLVWGHRAGFYGSGFGVGLLVTSSVILLVTLTLWTAASLNRIDQERRSHEEQVKYAAQRLEHALDISESAVVSVDLDQKIVTFDDRARKLFGFEPEEAIGQPLDLLLPERIVEDHRGFVRDFASSSEGARRMGERTEVYGRRKDGTEFAAEAAISKSDYNGKTTLTAVVRDVSERKRMEEEILHRERLAAANDELESFSYSVSHDLRAPLRHVDGFIQLLQKRASGSLDEQCQRYLDTIADSAKQMGVLIDDLLAFSRTSRAEMSMTKTDLRALVEEVLKTFSQEMDGREIEWKIDHLPSVKGDTAMLKQVFANLIENALKFTRNREKALIEVGATKGKKKTWVVFVRDNGVGFDMEYHDKLFGVFQRLHRQEEFEGTGIGLATVRRIVRRHQGEAWAEGEVGKGATVYFSLPKSREASV